MNSKVRRLETKKTVDLTPMIDVIFLLVIFFMTSSTLVKIKSIKIDLPEASAAETEVTSQTVFSINAQGDHFINGRQVKKGRLGEALTELSKKSKNKFLLVEGYKNVPYQKIIEVMSLAKESGFEKVSLSVKKSP